MNGKVGRKHASVLHVLLVSDWGTYMLILTWNIWAQSHEIFLTWACRQNYFTYSDSCLSLLFLATFLLTWKACKELWTIASDFPNDLGFIKPYSWAFHEVTVLNSAYLVPKLQQKQGSRLEPIWCNENLQCAEMWLNSCCLICYSILT